jgi:hypothetical protein
MVRQQGRLDLLHWAQSSALPVEPVPDRTGNLAIVTRGVQIWFEPGEAGQAAGTGLVASRP